MKKILLLSAAAAALALVSCNKETVSDGPGEGKPVEITVSIQSAPGTRATGVTYTDEAKVSSLQIFVFNGEDREAYRSVTGALQALVPATSGERSVWAIVNAPDLSSVSTLSGLKGEVTLLSANSKDNFIMTGNVTQELADGGNVAITVKRIVARVSIGKISTDLKEYRENYSVDVKGIYLINVAAENKYEVGGEAASWVNKLGHADSDYDPLLYDVLQNVNVSNGKPYETEHVFYPYPNIHGTNEQGVTPVYDAQWSPRGSILVIEATMLDADGRAISLNSNGQTVGYYPIALPVIERNKTYVIEEVKITRLPGEVPYKPIETGETQVVITVSEWEAGLNLGVVTI